MQSQLSNGQPHHHHHIHHHPTSPHHLPVSLVTSVSASFNYTSHLSSNHHPNFHPPTTLHHPQPLPFTPMVHQLHPIVSGTKLEPNKLSAFEHPTSNNTNTDHFKSQSNHISPSSPAQTIKSSSSIEPPSEGQTSPPSSLENGNNLCLAPTTNINRSNQNGLLDILMNSDKCQEFLQYQVHNSIVFSPLQGNPLDIALPSWEVLQVIYIFNIIYNKIL